MSFYFKMLSNVPGDGMSWNYSAQFKSTLQNEAKETERCAVFLQSTFFLKCLSTDVSRNEGSALGFATSFCQPEGVS